MTPLRLSLEHLRPRLQAALALALPRWPVWLAAGAVGGGIAVAAFNIFRLIPDSYPALIVGRLTVLGLAKRGDHAMFTGFFFGAALAFVVLALLLKALEERGGAEAVASAEQRLTIAVIPLLSWFASFLLVTVLNGGMYFLSLHLVIVTAIAFAVMAARPAVWMPPGAAPSPAIYEGLVLLPAAALLAALGVEMIGNRVAILFGPPLVKSANSLHWAMALPATIAGLLVVVWGLRGALFPVQARIRRLLIAIQVLLPGLFLALLPLPGSAPRRLVYDVPVRPEVWIFLALLALATWLDLARLWRKGERTNASPAEAVSVLALIALLVYCRMPNMSPLPGPYDDYHAGEDFVPWWSWIQHGMIPLWDFTPPRGLINYKMGLVASLFTEQTAAGLMATVPYLFAAMMLIVFPAVAAVIGKWRALLVMTFVTLDERLGDIDGLITAAFCVLIFAWDRCSHTRWLVIWFAVGTAAVLIAPGQGGLLVIATAPGGLWRLYQAYHSERAALLRAGAVTAAVTAALALLTPLGLMIAGAVRYGAGQSAVNGIANGLPWGSAFASVPNLHPWLVEILRFSWIAAGAAALVLTLWAWAKPQRDGRALFVGAAVAILCVLYIVRSGVRIDPGGIGRPGWTSVWVLSLLLPLLLSTLIRGPRALPALIFVVLAAATLTGQYATIGIDFALKRPLDRPVPWPNTNRIDGAALGMPNMGVVSMEQTHADHLADMKRTLDRLLAPDETFIDVTNAGARYYYFDRPPPADVSAFYNMITPGQQQRAVAQIVRRDIGVAMIGADSQILDGLTAAVRAPLLYRHLLLNFVPATIDGYDYMLRPDRLERAGLAPAAPDQPDEDALEILDRNFFTPFMDHMPQTLGHSAGRIADDLRAVAAFDAAQITQVAGTERQADGTFRVTGNIAVLEFDTSRVAPKGREAITPEGREAVALKGRDAGILSFDYQCLSPQAEPIIAIHWTGPDGYTDQKRLYFVADNGTMIVPLDAAPRWLLAPRIDAFRLELQPAGCTAFTLSNIGLAQRREVDDIKAAADATAPTAKAKP